jgi:gliding motility-associated-like protein
MLLGIINQVYAASVSNTRTLVTGLTIQEILDDPTTLDGDVIEIDVASGYTPEATVNVSKKVTIVAINGTTTLPILSVSVNPVVVTNITVNTINVSGTAKIQDAITAVNTGGVVNVSAGTYNESIVLTKSMTINGSGSPIITSLTLTNQNVTVNNTVVNTVVVQNGALVQDAVNLVKANGVVNISTGVYPENVAVSKAMTINGVGATSVNTFILSNKKVGINNVTVTTNTIDILPGGSIQDGIKAVATSGTINVAAGTYNENITLNNSVQVIGGPGATKVQGIQYIDLTSTITGFNAPDSIYVKNALLLQQAIDNVKDSGVVFIDSNYYVGKYTVTNKNIKFNSNPGLKVPVLDKMTINNTLGRVVTMAGQVKIKDSLNLTFGMVTTSGTNTFLLLDTAKINNGDDSTFINGPLMKESKTVSTRMFNFPVGKKTYGVRLVELDITQTLNTTTPGKDSVVYTVEYKTDGRTQIKTIPNQPFHPGWYPPTYWFIDNGGYKFFDAPKVTLHFDTTDVAQHLLNSTLGYGVAKTQGPNWSDLKQSTTVGFAPFLLKKGVISSFEVFKSFGDAPVTFFAIAPYNKCTSANVQPQPDFKFNNICENTTATFTNVSSIKRGSIVMFKWEIFDDTVGVGSDPVLNGYYTRIDTGFFVSPVNNPGLPLSHKFTNVGNYKVVLTAMSDTGCMQSNEQFIKVVPTPVMTFVSSPEGICNSNTASFKVNVQSVPTNETWTFGYTVSNTTAGSGAQTVTGKGSGTFSVTTPVLTGADKAIITLNTITNATISSAPACSTISNALQNVNLIPKPTFTAPTVCLNKESIFTNTTSASNAKAPTYLWNFADSTSATGSVQKHVYKKAGTFAAKLTVNSGNGCVDSLIQNVVVNALPVVVFTPANPIMTNAPTTPVSVTASTLYLWNTGEPGQVLSADTAGVYKVTITDANGCSNSGSVEVKPFKPSFIAPAVCDSLPMKFTNTTSTANIPFPQFEWNFGDGSNLAYGPVVTHSYGPNPGTYKVLLTVSSKVTSRVDTVTQLVKVNPFPVVTFNPTAPSVAVGSTVAITTTAGMNSYSWKTKATLAVLAGANTQTVTAPAAPGYYVVTIVDANSCTSIDSVKVELIDDAIIIANTLTPNNDNFNDTWWIDKIAAHPDCKVTVVNRYGEEVFNTTNYQNDWGGTYKGEILPDGTYYYVITCDSIEKIYKGHVNILKGK